MQLEPSKYKMMKITLIIAGSGGSFYCGNCLRDVEFIHAMKKAGHEITVIPMYLPLTETMEPEIGVSPVFFGAISLYIRQIIPALRKMPTWIDRFFNLPFFLKMAAKKAGSTRASGLEQMTISMLKGEEGNQKAELEMLVSYLKQHEKPDIVHISNALLSGLAPGLKKGLQVPVFCSLQDEDEWVDEMDTSSQKEIWGLINRNAKSIDAFISVSYYFKKKILKNTAIPEWKIAVVYNGINPALYAPIKSKSKPGTIAFLNRMSQNTGLDILIDAFILVKQKPGTFEWKLKIAGGFTSDEKPFLKSIRKKIKKAGLSNNVVFYTGFTDELKFRFLQSVDLLCYPVKREEAFGMPMIEAMAMGIPVIAADYGACPEIIQTTGGGMVYLPNNAPQLSDAIFNVMSDLALYDKLSKNAKSGCNSHFRSDVQVEKLVAVYKSFLHKHNLS